MLVFVSNIGAHLKTLTLMLVAMINYYAFVTAVLEIPIQGYFRIDPTNNLFNSTLLLLLANLKLQITFGKTLTGAFSNQNQATITF